MAVSVRVLVKIVLMAFLSLVEILERLDLDGERSLELSGYTVVDVADRREVCRIGVVYAGTVPCPGIGALPVQAERVYRLEIELENALETYHIGIEYYAYGLGVAGEVRRDFLIGGMEYVSVGISDFRGYHAADLLEIMFGAPKATGCEIDFPFQLGLELLVNRRGCPQRRHWVWKCWMVSRLCPRMSRHTAAAIGSRPVRTL